MIDGQPIFRAICDAPDKAQAVADLTLPEWSALHRHTKQSLSANSVTSDVYALACLDGAERLAHLVDGGGL